jgi:isohexenylglutaconyl-CoA hydratase
VTLPDCDHLVLRRDGWRLDVTLNRPEVRNAFNAKMWADIDAVFSAIRDDRSIRAVVLRGAGGNFSAGGDLKERDTYEAKPGEAKPGEDPLVQRNRRAGEIFTRIDRAPQAVIAVIEGYALGGGMGLACVADIALALESAAFRMPEATLGIPIAQIVPFLLRRVGASEVRRLVVSAARLNGAEAAALGLVHEAFPDLEALEGRLAAILAQLDRCAPGAIAESKRLINAAETMEQDALLDAAAEAFANAYRSEEGHEGAAAFRERRAPRWR